MRLAILLALLSAATPCRAQLSYKVQLTHSEGGAVVEVPAEKYVAAVLAGESSTFRSEEARKAMSVAARTYAVRMRGRHAAEGFDFCATTHCQRADLHGVTAELDRAVQATAGELLWFEGNPAFTVYSRDCGGQTANGRDLWPDAQAPYLASRSDPFCVRNGAARWSWTAPGEEIVTALRASGLAAPDSLRRVVVTDRTASQRARTLELIGRDRSLAISAGSFRLAVGRNLGWNQLRSDRYDIESGAGQIHFRGMGEGHGAGLCQHGADAMGLEGHSYREILAFYYPGTVLALTGAGLKWSQMAGENVKVFSTDPNRDRLVLSVAQTVRRDVAAQFPIGRVTVRVYPDLETFRNATGEPGWIAAHTSGTVIDLQPLAVLQARGILRQTLRHEFLHVAIDHDAAPGLPVWFREGLVEYLDGTRKNIAADAREPVDFGLRQRQNWSRAKAAYAQAQTRVAELVNRYGEDTVLGWIRRGLPADVTNSNTSSAETNSR